MSVDPSGATADNPADPSTLLVALGQEVALSFAEPQPPPAAPADPKARREAAAQLRQANDDSYPADGSDPADGTSDPHRPGSTPAVTS